MPSENERQRQGDQTEDKRQPRSELSSVLEELDRACARARQLIYQVRPLLRTDTTSATEQRSDDKPQSHDRRRFRARRRDD